MHRKPRYERKRRANLAYLPRHGRNRMGTLARLGLAVAIPLVLLAR